MVWAMIESPQSDTTNGMSGPALLHVPLYSMSEAAELLEIPTATLSRWLRGTKRLAPVIQGSEEHPDAVTWGQFVEARLLRGYRGLMSLQRLRRMLDRIRQKYKVPYPLAHYRPWVDEATKELVFDAQKTIDLPGEEFVVRSWGGPPRISWQEVEVENIHWQLQWAWPIKDFLSSIEFDEEADVAVKLYPFGREAHVVIDPEVSFGVPHVGGFRTEALAEAYATGDSYSEIARDWNLTEAEVEAAVRWELRKRAA